MRFIGQKGDVQLLQCKNVSAGDAVSEQLEECIRTGACKEDMPALIKWWTAFKVGNQSVN